MDKTLAYWIERLIGITLGLTVFFLIYSYGYNDSALLTGKYYDIIIKASSSLFGFLLTILALLVNSSNSKVVEMKAHGSFSRLVHYHRVAVLLAFILVIFSVILYSIVEPESATIHFNSRYGSAFLEILICSHTAISVWAAIDTLIFVIIFYKIII